MVFSQRLLQLSSLLSVAYALPQVSNDFQWKPCNETELPSTEPMDCGTLEVPLDYSDPSSNKTLTLELAKVSAKKPSKGSILVNFGGPGQEGRTGLGSLGHTLSLLSDGQYDIIAFDPRGTGNTIPFRCYEDDADTIKVIDQQKYGRASDVILGELWAYGGVLSETCLDYAEETGSLIGTAFVARDLMSVVDALDEDGMLRYWGFSYGTTLGATVAAMFPDRIDKMVLDGVQNVHEYYHASADFEEWTQSDETFSGIFSSCLEAPESCALATPDATAEELEQSVFDYLEHLKYNPIPLKNTIFDYSKLRALLSGSLYSTDGWPSTTALLYQLMNNNLTEAGWDALEAQVTTDESTLADTMGVIGIHCVDRIVRTATLEDFMPTISQLHNSSEIMGDGTDALSMTCAQWKIEPKEVYLGDFEVQTANPVLFVGNTYDGHTPIASARNVSAGFEDSVVLEVNGFGHASLGLPSACSHKHVSAYWNDGTMPEEGTICEVDAHPFGNTTWDDVLAGKVNNGDNKARLFKH